MADLTPRAGLGKVRVNRPVSRFDLRAAPVVLGALGAVAGLARLAPAPTGSTAGRRVRIAARLMKASAALLGIAVLADSALEHYRGNFHNPAMFVPLVSSSLLTATNLAGLMRGGNGFGAASSAVHLIAGGVGLAGLGFHLYDVGSRPGGYDWVNLFYAAPLGAPAALSLAALIGYSADLLRLDLGPSAQRLAGLPFGRALASIVGLGLAGTAAEAGLLHFRGAFHNPFMLLPVSLPPVASLLMMTVSIGPAGGGHRLVRAWLWATALLGLGGTAFHAYGISRNMGGWRNWSQNLLAGPPLPAPPSFSALALAGLAALELMPRKLRSAGDA